MGLFGGRFYSCSTPGAEYPGGMAECSGFHVGQAGDEGFMVPRAWVNPTYNFDTFTDSVNALFRVNNMNYVVMQFTAMDITELHKSPVQGNSKAYAIFFVLYVIVGALFVMNLFVGFIVDGFNAHNGTTEEDILYSRYTRQIKVHAPRFHGVNPPKNVVSRFLRSILETKNFEIFSGSCVLINIVFMLTGDAAAHAIGSAYPSSLCLSKLHSLPHPRRIFSKGKCFSRVCCCAIGKTLLNPFQSYEIDSESQNSINLN
jgi:hypothetical protein